MSVEGLRGGGGWGGTAEQKRRAAPSQGWWVTQRERGPTFSCSLWVSKKGGGREGLLGHSRPHTQIFQGELRVLAKEKENGVNLKTDKKKMTKCYS